MVSIIQKYVGIRNSQGNFFLSKATTIQRKKPDMNHNQVQFLKPKNTHPVWDSYQGPWRHVRIGWAIICRVILRPLIRSVGYLFWSYRWFDSFLLYSAYVIHAQCSKNLSYQTVRFICILTLTGKAIALMFFSKSSWILRNIKSLISLRLV